MMDEPDLHVFPAEYLNNFATEVFMHFGVAEADARQAADVLLRSDLRGIDSHGVARLHTYFDMLQMGRIDPKPRITIVRTDAPGMARWRKKLFVAIARNASNPVALFGLPDDQTVILSAHIEL